MRVIWNGPGQLKYNGQRYENGEEVELDEAEVKRLAKSHGVPVPAAVTSSDPEVQSEQRSTFEDVHIPVLLGLDGHPLVVPHPDAASVRAAQAKGAANAQASNASRAAAAAKSRAKARKSDAPDADPTDA